MGKSFSELLSISFLKNSENMVRGLDSEEAGFLEFVDKGNT